MTKKQKKAVDSLRRRKAIFDRYDKRCLEKKAKDKRKTRNKILIVHSSNGEFEFWQNGRIIGRRGGENERI